MSCLNALPVPERKEERVETDLRLHFGEGEGVARNVSASGIYFLTNMAFKEGQRVKFTLEFMNFAGGAIEVKCIARIVRVEDEEQGAGHGVGAAISSFEFRRLPG
jgi:PilZ domain